MKKIVFIVFLNTLGLFLFSSSVYAIRYDGPYEGRVIDADTGEPIEGVVILGVWYKALFSPAGATHKFHDAQEAVTDMNGEFSITGLGFEVFSNVEPMNVLIFKAGYEYIGMGPWRGLKKDLLLRKKIKWEGDKAIVPLRKLTLEERNKQGSPSDPPAEAPFEKVRLILREIDRNNIERGVPPRKIWNGQKIE